MVVLAHLQGVVATFRVGRYHHRGPLYEGRGLTHALTHTAPTDLTVADATPLGAQAQSDRTLRLLHVRQVGASRCPQFVLDALKRACQSPSLQPSRSARSALSGCCGVGERVIYSKRRRSCLWSRPVNMRTWRLVPDPIVMVHVPLQSSDTALWRSGTHARKQFEIWAQFQPHPLCLYPWAVARMWPAAKSARHAMRNLRMS